MKNFSSKYGPWAIVTGATSGIGRAISIQLAEQGLSIIAVARNESKLAGLKAMLETTYSISVETISEDLSRPDSIQAIKQQTQHLDIGLLVANAGIENNGLFVENDVNTEDRLLALNVTSVMKLSHMFGKRFAQRGKGGMLLTSSMFGYQGVPYLSSYAASKAYVLSLGEALNVELKPFGVDVTVLSPGLTKTAMVKNMAVDFSKMPITSHTPEYVAKIGLNALGSKATVVPGLINKIYAWENRLLPRSWPVKLFGFLLKRASHSGYTMDFSKNLKIKKGSGSGTG